MGIYKRFRGMSKKAKISLGGTVLYATTSLALPVYAVVQEPVQEVVQPVNLENIVTIDQAESLYKEKIAEYSADKIINIDELNNLYKVSSKLKELLPRKSNELITEYSEKGVELEKVDSEIKKYNQQLESNKKLRLLADVRERLDKEVLIYYPALIDKSRGNVVYGAGDNLTGGLNTVLKDIISKANNILKEAFNDNSLERILKYKYYDMNDILVIYNIIQGRDTSLDLEKEKKILLEISGLEKQKAEILAQNQEVLVIKEGMENIENLIDQNSKQNHLYKRYFEQKDFIKNWEGQFGNFNKEWAVGLIKEIVMQDKGLKGGDLDDHMREIRRNNMEVISNLESNIRNYGFDVEVEDISNPAAKRIPWWLGTIALGFGIPIVRNLIVKKYVKSKKANDGEYFAAGFVGTANGVVGLAFDGFHPLVLPVRLLSPLILQPAFKLFKIDPCKSFVES
ncbi:MAG: hypothetical protein KKA79_09375 [Nanoarchaeota archaeon]|nr:hypothetical protein [Nanoarchaeota archaeon]